MRCYPVYVLLEVSPVTGRRHQIRVHLSSVGRPLVSDSAYNLVTAKQVDWCPRMFLHCHRMGLLDIAGLQISYRLWVGFPQRRTNMTRVARLRVYVFVRYDRVPKTK